MDTQQEEVTKNVKKKKKHESGMTPYSKNPTGDKDVTLTIKAMI